MRYSDKAVPVVLGLGSNKPFDGLAPLDLLNKACNLLGSRLCCMSCSSVYISKAMYYSNQADFYNMVVFGMFNGSPEELLSFTQDVEVCLGRNRLNEFRNGPRSMDIDIEFFGSVKINSPLLQIPHPRVQERAFVLVPMLEILQENAESIYTGFINVDFYQKCLRKLPSQDVCKLDLPRFVMVEK